MIQHQHQRVGVFIDVQNMYYSARHLFNKKVNFGAIVKKTVGDRQLIRAIAYVVSTKTDEHRPFFEALLNIGIETKEKELVEFVGGQKKADWDVGIAVDAIRLGENLDVIVLVSGDGDFIPLVEYLQSKGKIVEVASFRETTASKLVDQVGQMHYINLSAQKRLFLIPGGYKKTFTIGAETPRGSSDIRVAQAPAPVRTPTVPVLPPPKPVDSKPSRTGVQTPTRRRGRSAKPSAARTSSFIPPDDSMSPTERYLRLQ